MLNSPIKIHFLFSVMMASLLLSCSTQPGRFAISEDIANTAGMDKEIIHAGLFNLTTYTRNIRQENETLVVYIEGDGMAYLGKNRVSPDPTPANPVGLRLAAQDLQNPVLYIARPCQYLPEPELHSCDKKYWTSHRYAGEVIDAINSVINRYVHSSTKTGLVGYSGGATIAALVAARRKDVSWLVTLAGNMDHRAWTTLHKISALDGSLNPPDYAGELGHVPQLHLVGEDDVTVPASIVRSFLDIVQPRISELKVFPGFDHQCCWTDIWPEKLCDATGMEFTGVQQVICDSLVH